MRLHDLDDRLVPRIAARLRALVDGAEEGRTAARRRVYGVNRSLLDPDPRSPLRRLDDRFASSGPLALLRDVPQLGLLVVSAVFLAGAGVALARSGGEQRVASTQQQIDSTAPTALGPEIGTNIDAYVAASRKRAVLVSRGSADGVYTALVSFSTYLTPKQTRLTLGQTQITKVLLHAPLPSADVLPIDVSNFLPETRKLYADIARRKAQDVAEFTKLAGSIQAQSKEEEQFKAFYLMAAAQAAREVRAYRGDCACVIAVLVRGPARELAELLSIARVRAVEIGGRDLDETLLIRPLAPEQKGIVRKIATPTAGNGA